MQRLVHARKRFLQSVARAACFGFSAFSQFPSSAADWSGMGGGAAGRLKRTRRTVKKGAADGSNEVRSGTIQRIGGGGGGGGGGAQR